MSLPLTSDMLDAGSLNIPGVAPANFTFLLDSDDGSLLMLDGNVVISDPGAEFQNEVVVSCPDDDVLWFAGKRPQ